MQTHEWEALLEGTTEGPWEVETIPELRYSNGETWEELGHHVVYGENGPLFATGEQTWEDAEQYQDNEANIRLAAHAPAAVAEVVRLRREIEDMLRTWHVKEAVSMELRDSTQHPQKAVHARFLKTHQHVTQRLTRILEGDTHE